MAEELRKVTVGEPVGDPSAAFQHATVDTIRYVRELQRTGGAGVGDSASSARHVWVKNTSAADLDRFSVLGIDDTVFPTPTDNPSAFKTGPIHLGVTPDVDVHERKFVILLSAAKVDAIVPAAISGITIAKVNVTDDDHHKYARIKDDDAGSMESAPAGYPILYRESGLGVKWAEVNLGFWDNPPVHFMLDENHPGRGISFDVLVGAWDRASDTHDYDDTWMAKAVDWFKAVPPILPAKCAAGHGFWERSDAHDWVIDVWQTDCASPGCPS